jgi:plasmid stabilization system protein ParE
VLRLIWRRSARDDAAAIFNYIADRNVAAAERLLAAIELCAEGLADRPFCIGRAASRERARP